MKDLHLGEMLKERLANQHPVNMDNMDLLKKILEKIAYEREYELFYIGQSARFNTQVIHGDNRILETGETVYKECQLSFKRLPEYDADLRKIDQVISTISKLASKYLG
jgi:hypothetical protein